MGETRPKPAQGELMPGTLDMLILKTLSRGAMHGYSIAQFIQQASRDVLRVEEGALYPALHRLEVRGLLKAEWGTSDNNRRAKFYTLTAVGRRELDEEAAYWDRVAAAVTRAMHTSAPRTFAASRRAFARCSADSASSAISTKSWRFTSRCARPTTAAAVPRRPTRATRRGAASAT